MDDAGGAVSWASFMGTGHLLLRRLHREEGPRQHVTVYEKGSKALVSLDAYARPRAEGGGNEAGEFAREVLRPLVMGGELA